MLNRGDMSACGRTRGYEKGERRLYFYGFMDWAPLMSIFVSDLLKPKSANVGNLRQLLMQLLYLSYNEHWNCSKL